MRRSIIALVLLCLLPVVAQAQEGKEIPANVLAGMSAIDNCGQYRYAVVVKLDENDRWRFPALPSGFSLPDIARLTALKSKNAVAGDCCWSFTLAEINVWGESSVTITYKTPEYKMCAITPEANERKLRRAINEFLVDAILIR